MTETTQSSLAAFTLGEDVVPTQIRIARPTDRLEDVIAFYRNGLGLPELYRFSGHDGYDGIMLGLPGKAVHLEFTRHVEGSRCPAPTRDNLLVLYVTEASAYARLNARMACQGHLPVEPENPYWLGKSQTYEDPDGWRVVICQETGV